MAYAHPCREYGYAVMLGKLCIERIDVWIIKVGFGYPALEAVDYKRIGSTPEEG